MKQVVQQTEPGNTDASTGGAVTTDARSPSRRRLIKLGAAAVPVVATLASRPALAWHCQSTSAWGSTMVVGTSLQHTTTTSFETWFISDWKNNYIRGTAGAYAPWSYVWPKLIPSDKDACRSNTSNPSSDTNFDYTKVTCAMLARSTIPGPINCAGASGTVTVTSLLAANHRPSSLIVAQLNLLLTPSSTNKGVMGTCLGNSPTDSSVGLTTLRNWASGSLPLGWTQQNVIDYLSQNWIARWN